MTDDMTPKFGTSGLRGLVTELTPACVSHYVARFIAACPMGNGLYVGHDLRASSPALAQTVCDAAMRLGQSVTSCGPVPTPALALAAMQAESAAIMVTGSHIPADRNGLKFYTPAGEITKADEQAILSVHEQPVQAGARGAMFTDPTVNTSYMERYTTSFAGALTGMRIGLYQHSAVGRDLVHDLLTKVGAEVVPFGWSPDFVPVDTEAISPTLSAELRAWAKENVVDAIVSTDADGDRPLLADQSGFVVPGDIMCQIAAAVLGAETVVTPISSNTSVRSGTFAKVISTKIGSPFVIAGMKDAAGLVAGYEANDGFLLGFAAQGPAGPLAPLMTRDAMLPVLCVLSAARTGGLDALISAQSQRFTAADRLQDVAIAQAKRLLDDMMLPKARAAFLAPLGGSFCALDETDGPRMTLTDGRIIHLRMSGNAPELRIYVEADTRSLAKNTLARALDVASGYLSTDGFHRPL